MHGLTIDAHIALPEACEAEAVIVGCGAKTREIIADAGLMAQLRLDPARQLVGAQRSGAPILARLGWLNGIPACTDLASRPWAQAAGVDVLRQSFFAKDNVATAGGCLASVVLAVWVLARLTGPEEAPGTLRRVAPAGEVEDCASRAMAEIVRICRADRNRSIGRRADGCASGQSRLAGLRSPLALQNSP